MHLSPVIKEHSNAELGLPVVSSPSENSCASGAWDCYEKKGNTPYSLQI